MTDILYKEDTDWITLIDFEEDIACDWNQVEECTEEVVWRLTNLCCGVSFMLCDPHHKYELSVFESDWGIRLCPKCETVQFEQRSTRV